MAKLEVVSQVELDALKAAGYDPGRGWWPRKNGKWKSFIQEFLNSGQEIAKIQLDPCDGKTPDSARAALCVAINRFYKGQVAVFVRKKQVYIVRF